MNVPFPYKKSYLEIYNDGIMQYKALLELVILMNINCDDEQAAFKMTVKPFIAPALATLTGETT